MPLARVDHRGLSNRTAVVAYLQGFWPQMLPAVEGGIHVASLALGSLRAGLTVSSITTSLPTSRFGIKRTTAPLGVEVNSLLALLAGLSEKERPTLPASEAHTSLLARVLLPQNLGVLHLQLEAFLLHQMKC